MGWNPMQTLNMIEIIRILLITFCVKGSLSQCPTDSPDPVDPFTIEEESVGVSVGVSPTLVGGGGTCIIAMLLYNNTIQESHHDSFDAMTLPTFSFNAFGDYNVVLYLSNNSTSVWDIGIIHVDEELVGFENTVVESALWDDVNWINFGLISGSRFTIFIDWDDNIVEERYFITLESAQQFGHIYELPGTYSVKITVSNSLNTFHLEPTTFSEYPVSGLTVSAPLGALYPPGVVEFSLTHPGPAPYPNNVNCTVNLWNDTEVDNVPVEFNATHPTSNLTTLSFPLGWYSVTLRCFNHISIQQDDALTFPFELASNVTGLAVAIPSLIYYPYVPLETPTNFTVTLTSGSNVTAFADFNDSTPIVQAGFPQINASVQGLDVNKTYSATGPYFLTIACNNTVGHQEISVSIEVVVPLGSLDIVAGTSSLPNAIFTLNMMTTVNLEFTNLDPVNCTFYFGDGSQDFRMIDTLTGSVDASFVVSMADPTVFDFVKLYPYNPYGFSVSVSVNCWNRVSNLTANLTTEIRQPIENLTLATLGPIGAKVNENVDLLVSILKGTNVTVNVTCDSLGTNMAELFYIPDGTLETNTVCNYTMLGNYTVFLIADNEVSSENTTVEIIVQQKINDIIVTSDSPVPNPPGLITFFFTTVDPKPSEVFAQFDFDQDGNNDTDGIYSPLISLSSVSTLQYTFPEDFLGNYTCVVFFKNMVSSFTTTAIITIEEPIHDPHISTETYYVLAGNFTTVIVTVMNGSHVTYDIDFDDGSINTFTPNVIEHDGISFATVHVFTRMGIHTIRGNASNSLGSIPFTTYEVYGRWPLIQQEIELDYAYHVKVPPGVGTFTFNLTENHLPYPDDVTAIVYLPTTGYLVQGVTSWPFSIDLNFGTGYPYGVVDAAVLLTNNVSSVWFNRTLYLEEEILNPSITGDKYFLQFSSLDYMFSVSSGTDVNVTLTSQGGNITETDIVTSGTNITQSFPLIETTNITAFFFNHVSNATAEFEVIVQPEVIFNSTSNAPLPLPSLFNWTLSIAPPVIEEYYSFDIRFGDGSSVTMANVHVIGSQSFTYSYGYDFGDYIISANISNNVSSQQITEIIHTDIPIIGPNFTVFSLINDTDDELGIVYEPDVPINFSATIMSGSRASYSYESIGYEMLHGSQESMVFVNDGPFNVTLTAYNSVNSENITHIVWIDSPVGLEEYIQPDKVYMVDMLHIDLVFDFAKNICLHFVYKGPATVEFWHESLKDLCKNRANVPDGMKVGLLPWGNIFNVSTRFQRFGMYEETLGLYTEDKEQTKTYDLYVSRYACENPLVVVPDAPGKDIDHPKQVGKSRALEVSTEDAIAAIDCRESSFFYTEWKMFKLADVTDPLGEELELDEIKKEKFFMQCEKGMLEYGFYRVQLSIYMEELSIFNTTTSLFYEIIPTPLVAGIAPGTLRYVGNRAPIVIDAHDMSSDPDNPVFSIAPMVFTWFCHKEGESIIPEVDLISVASIVWPGTKTVPNEGDTVVDGPGAGGCFKTGPGRLDVSADMFTIPESYIEPGNYILILRVEKGIRRTIATQKITVIDGNPLTVDILVDRPSKCPLFFSPENDNSFYGSCKECSPSVMPRRMKWKLVDHEDNSISMKGKSSEQLEQGDTASTLTTHKSLLTHAHSYVVSLAVLHDGDEYDNGLGMLEVETSPHPHPGSCTVSLEEAVFLKDAVEVQCAGWTNSEGGSIDVTVHLTATVAGVTTDIPSTRAFLPLGEPEKGFKVFLHIHVLEPCGSSYTEERIIKVTLEGYIQGMSAEEINKLKLEAILEAIANLDLEGIKLAPSNAASLIASAISATDLESTEIPEIEDAIGKLAKALLLSEDPYTPSATATLSETLATVANTITPNMDDDVLGSVFEMLDKLADAMPDMMADPLDVSLISKIGNALSATSASLMKNHAEQEEIESLKVIKVDDPPTEFENKPPELQNIVVNKEKKKEEKRMKTITNVEETLEETAVDACLSIKHGITLGNKDFMIKSSLTKKSMVTLTSITTSKCETELIESEPFPCDSKVFFTTFYETKNHLTYGDGSNDINGATTSLKMYGADCPVESYSKKRRRRKRSTVGGADQVDYEGLFTMTLDMTERTFPEINMTDSPVDVNTSMIYYFVPIEDGNQGLIIDLDPIDDMYLGEKIMVFSTFQAEEKYDFKPTQTHYDQVDMLPKTENPNPWSIVIREEVPKVPGAYIGLLVVESTFSDNMREIVDIDGVNKSVIPDDLIVTNGTTFPFRVFSSFTSCRNWEAGEWQNTTCKISNLTTTDQTKCDCIRASRATDTMSTAFKPPSINTIDFRNVLANFATLLAGNPAVFATIIGILVVYIVLFVWVRIADRKDVIKWGIYPLMDNSLGDNYKYSISVLTGVRQDSGTKSSVRIIITGDGGDSGIRTLEGGPMDGFGRGTIRRFLMTTDQPLGQLTYIHIWHDNSGEDSNQGWYLDKVLIEDLQTEEKYHFLCDDWLAVDEGDGKIERILPLAGSADILQTKNLFASSSKKKIADEHLWISVFARPERSKFTRKERLTCGASLLFITMITDAMWYKSEGSTKNDQALTIGPIIISAATLYVSVMATLCSVPISSVIIIFFQKSRPKPDKPGELPSAYAPPKAFYKPKKERTPEEALAAKRYWRQFPLPFWCTYIAWTLAILSIILSGFFVILYSLEWGRLKAEGWLSAFFLAFFQNVFVVQPFKVIVVALIFACIFKKLDEQDEKAIKQDDSDDKEEKEIELPGKETGSLGPLKDENLEKARYLGTRKKLAKRVIKEILLHIVFLIIIMYLAWGNRSNADFLIKQSVIAMLNPGGDGDYVPLKGVTDGHATWAWIKKTLVPAIYWQKHYNGEPTSRLLGKYINDFNSVRLGTVRLRQVRVESELCPHGTYEEVCRPPYGMTSQGDRSYSEKWLHVLPNASLPIKSRVAEAFTFKTFLELQNIPYFGTVGLYGGGGYVAELGNNSASALYLIDRLIENDWIDKQTRAVFFETTIYNANVHVFASIICLFEFPPSGGVFPRIYVDSFHAYANVGNKGTITVGVMAIFVLFLLFLAFHEGFKIKENRREYFSNPWNKVEIVFLAMAFGCVGMHGTKEAYARYITEKVKEEKNANIGYMQLSAYEIVYNAMVGMVTFTATIKCLRLLNFSKNIRELGRSLKLVRNELLSFTIIFLMLFIGFATFGNQVFGHDMYGFSTIIRSLESLFAALLGKYDYYTMTARSAWIGHLFLVLFNAIMMLIMVNIFIGFLTFCFEQAYVDVAAGMDDDVWIYIFHRLKVLLRLETVDDDPATKMDWSREEKDDKEVMDEGNQRRDQLRSLDMHLHYLDQYLKSSLEKPFEFPHLVKYDLATFNKLNDILKEGKTESLLNRSSSNVEQSEASSASPGSDRHSATGGMADENTARDREDEGISSLEGKEDKDEVNVQQSTDQIEENAENEDGGEGEENKKGGQEEKEDKKDEDEEKDENGRKNEEEQANGEDVEKADNNKGVGNGKEEEYESNERESSSNNQNIEEPEDISKEKEHTNQGNESNEGKTANKTSGEGKDQGKEIE